MRLKATFTIELEAGDFVEAAGHQRTLEQTLAALREIFPQSQLKIVNSRERGVARTSAPRINRNITGRLHAYQE